MASFGKILEAYVNSICTWSYTSIFESRSMASGTANRLFYSVIKLSQDFLVCLPMAFSLAALSVSLYIFRYSIRSLVPRTFAISLSWSSLEDPMKKGSLMNICIIPHLYDAGEHNSQRPDIQRIVVVLVVHKQLRSLKVSACHPYVVFLSGKIELSKPPVYHPELFAFVIDHNVLWFDVTVHDAVGVAEVQTLCYTTHVP